MENETKAQAIKKIIIAVPKVDFAEGLKKHIEHAGLKVIEIVVVLEHLLQTLHDLNVKGEQISGLLVSSDIAKKLNDKRLEFLSDSMLTIREQFSDIQIVFLSNEQEGHPILAELVAMGIYNIYVKSSTKTRLPVDDLIGSFNKSKFFSDVMKFRDFDSSIPWRRISGGGAAAVQLIPSENEKSMPVIFEKEKVVEKEVIKVVEKEVVRVVEKVVEIDKVRDVTTPPKLVVIGGMYPGAGSTFLTLTLGRLLNYIGISHAVVEHPSNQPELHSILFGEKHEPKGYRFLSDDMMNQGSRGPREEWIDGHTTWYPLNPKGLPDGKLWSTDLSLKFLYQVKKPIVLLDVSHHWGDPSVKEIALDADELFFVIDTFLPSKYSRPDSKANEEILYEFKKFGKSVNIVANRDIRAGKRAQWIKSLPYAPISIVPDISYKEVITSLWDSKFFQDQPEHRATLLAATYSILGKLVPPNYPIKHLKKMSGGNGASVLQKLFKVIGK